MRVTSSPFRKRRLLQTPKLMDSDLRAKSFFNFVGNASTNHSGSKRGGVSASKILTPRSVSGRKQKSARSADPYREHAPTSVETK